MLEGAVFSRDAFSKIVSTCRDVENEGRGLNARYVLKICHLALVCIVKKAVHWDIHVRR